MNPFLEEIVARAAAAMGLEPAAVRMLISVPPDEAMGDYAIPCFTLAKERKQNPAAIAGDIAGEIAEGLDSKEAASSHIDQVEALGPYVNFTLNRGAFIAHTLNEISAQGAGGYGSRNQGVGKTLVIDFSSPNLARPFSIAHLRSTAIGNAIYRLHAFTGWHCVGINHLGDYGANFGQLLAAYRLWADEEAVRANPVPELLALYIRFNEEASDNPDLKEQAKSCLRALADGDEEMVGLWRYFIDEGTKEAERIYGILDVHFDEFLGESFFADKLEDVVVQFEAAGLAEESEGALIVRLDDEDMPPCMLRTSNGTSTYHSRDIAALLHRHQQYDFDKMVYVTDMRQALHFRQLFRAIELLGLEWASQCVHAPFGMMSFKGAAIATRKGNIVFLEEVLEQAVALTAGIIAQKNPNLENRHQIADQVGISAIIFADINNRRTRDISFDLEDVLNFDGETGPYVQYTHARFCSIVRKHGSPADPDAELSRLGEAAEMRVARQLAEFPDTVERACNEDEPSYLAAYLIDLATVGNRLYNELPVLVAADAELTVARVRLVDAVCQVLRCGLSLLGMKAPEQM